MSNLSDLLPAGAGGKQVDFVASGTLGSGVTVALRADGTVEAVGVTPEGAGTAVVFESASSSYISATYDSTNNKVVIAYIDAGNSSYGTAIVGTVSGTSISFGTAVVFESASSNYISATYDSTNGKIVIAYKDQGNSSFGTAIVGTVSGTSISFGTAVVFQSGNSNYNSATYDSTNNKVVIASANWDNSRFGTAIVGTVSGTAISFGTAVVFESAQSDYISATYDSTNGKVVIAYRDAGNSSYGTAIVGTVSGTSISFGTAVVFESASSSYISATYDSTNGKIVIAYKDQGNSSFGTAVVYSLASSNNTSFIGITDAAISSAASGSVTIKGGISTNVTGLTANSTYYVQSDGTLSTASSSVLAGKALSSTSINLDYTT